MNKFFWVTLFSPLLLVACRENSPPPNPFEQAQRAKDGVLDTATVNQLPADNFISLHQQILMPTCANAGCHDGHFEPDFRTIESAYNTLVYHPVVKNNPDGTFSYRVVPGDPENSLLLERMLRDIDGQSGIMPLVADTEWENAKEEHIANIRKWIGNGAPDIFGNVPQLTRLNTAAKGAVAFIAGRQEPLERKGGNGALLIPPGIDQLNLYLSLTDPELTPSELNQVKLRVSEDPDDFANVSSHPVNVLSAPIHADGFTGDTEVYYHYCGVDLTALTLGDTRYFRIYIQIPGQSELTELPTAGSIDYVKEQFAFQIHD